MRLSMLTLSIIYIECDLHITSGQGEGRQNYVEICKPNDQDMVKTCRKVMTACYCANTWKVRCDNKDIWIGSLTLDNGCQTLSGATADTSIENLIQMGTASADNDDDLKCVRHQLPNCAAYVCARKEGDWNLQSWHICTDGDTSGEQSMLYVIVFSCVCWETPYSENSCMTASCKSNVYHII
ncbi:uncharacterized protein LOC124281022 [Haliotis rubra]|uniref:uncharacterized protein LOC124281022 n=1 Tax=Haliotis rubra TaxID=36100 RepID=UPI001EE5EC93|nr:uncharacterized protein LOC124281022 [Haliotis rubra]